jgi:hypothetical protein
MKIFDAVLLIGIVLLISLGAVFSHAMFSSLNTESVNSSAYTNSTLTQYEMTYSWIYVIAALLIIVIIIIAFKLLQNQADH